MRKQKDRAALRFQFTVHDSAFVRALQGAFARASQLALPSSPRKRGPSTPQRFWWMNAPACGRASSSSNAGVYWFPVFAGMTPLKPCFVLSCTVDPDKKTRRSSAGLLLGCCCSSRLSRSRGFEPTSRHGLPTTSQSWRPSSRLALHTDAMPIAVGALCRWGGGKRQKDRTLDA